MDTNPSLVYTAECKCATKAAGDPVAVGDIVKGLHNDQGHERYVVTFFRYPSSSNSEGKVSLATVGAQFNRESYVSIIGAHWINRNDR